MIAADASSLIAFISGKPGPDVSAIDWALQQKILVLPPTVFSELLSDPKLPDPIYETLRKIPFLSIDDLYWERTGRLRAALLLKGFKPSLADAFIAQSCLDHRLPLITRDRDFQAFQRIAGLNLFES